MKKKILIFFFLILIIFFNTFKIIFFVFICNLDKQQKNNVPTIKFSNEIKNLMEVFTN